MALSLRTCLWAFLLLTSARASDAFALTATLSSFPRAPSQATSAGKTLVSSSSVLLQHSHCYRDSSSRSGSPVSRVQAAGWPLFSASSDTGEIIKELDVPGIKDAPDKTEWKDNLLKASTYASALCVLDCTILPLVTIVLPLFGIVAASPAQMEWLHQLGHSLALWFVLPVGGLATSMNYLFSHRKLWIAAAGWTGLALVLASNVGCGLTHNLAGPVGTFVGHWLHVLHDGAIHRAANLAGCFFLLGSNYLSHKNGGCAAPACDHDHSPPGGSSNHSHNH